MIDATEGFTEQDSKVAGYAHEQGKASVIAINKWDAVEKDGKTMQEFTKKLEVDFSFMSYAPFVFISALTGQRVDKLFEQIKYTYSQNIRRISTGMIIVPYLLCGINTAIIVTKIKTGEDIRTLGSGNAGLTNTLRTQGKIAALFVLLGDVLKGTLSILIVRFSFLWLTGTDTANPDNMMTYVGFAAAVAAIIGHVFPIYFGFKGGKGILVSVAVLMTVEWIPACILLGIFIIVVALTRYVSLGSCIAAVCYPVTILVYSLITGDPCVWINVILSALIAVLILFMHRGNLVRLKNHTEKKLGQKA